ncbi:MAG: hypothetical protein OEU36_07010 [Gammaproteobacteria bacterium]|nr:hypothetical protein [Gammaproteobacteria bacterium]
MHRLDWHYVERIDPPSTDAAFAALDHFAEQSSWSRLRFKSGDSFAIALKLNELGAEPGAAPSESWVLIISRALSPEDLKQLQGVAVAALPAGQPLSHTARVRAGEETAQPDELLVPKARVCLTITPLSAGPPKLGAETELRKLPEGPIGDRESWFRGRTGRKGDK